MDGWRIVGWLVDGWEGQDERSGLFVGCGGADRGGGRWQLQEAGSLIHSRKEILIRSNREPAIRSGKLSQNLVPSYPNNQHVRNKTTNSFPQEFPLAVCGISFMLHLCI